MTDITRVVAAAEALIEPLRNAAWAGPVPCPVCDQAADAIAALLDAVQGLREAEPVAWVSVDDRLPTPPDDGSDVPVWTWNGEFVTEDDYAEQFEQPAGPAVGGWVSTGWGFGQDYSLGRAAVTHWMPRETPKPPTAAPTQEGAPK